MTRDRMSQIAILAVVAAIGIWIAFNTYWTEVKVPTPLQGEAATNPYYSLEHLLHALGVRTQRVASLRSLPSVNAVLLVTEWSNDEAHGRMDALEHWVQGGGRLVVTAGALWSGPAMQKWSGIAPSHRDAKPHAGAKPPLAPVPVAPTPTMSPTPTPAPVPTPTPVRTRAPSPAGPDSDCAPMTVENRGGATGEELQICRPMTEFSFVSTRHPAWSLSNERGLQMLRVDIGRGSLTVAGPEFLSLPRVFLRGDNAQAFIEGAQLNKGERLLIFTPSQAEQLLAMLWRVAAPAIVCFGLAIVLLILRHLPLFGPPAPVPVAARRSLAEQLRANARFAWRTGNVKSLRRAVLRALERSAAQHIAGYGSLTARRRAAELGKRAGIDPSLLNSAMTEDAAGTPGVQRAAIALLEQTRRALLDSHPTQGTVHDR